MNDYEENITESLEALKEMNLEDAMKKKSKEIIEQVGNGKNYYLIPKAVISPYGILCFILLQFIIFRIFLYLNRKRFLE